jgi:tripartite-type tricarboxylate transporter receptor subunit TctC
MDRRDQLAWLVLVLGVLFLGFLRFQRGDDGRVFPQRGITLVVPHAAGGGTDLLSRALARSAEPHLGRGITIHNVTGGAGAVGFTAGLLARPDGYTVTTVTFELASLPLQGLVPFTHEDFDLLMRLNIDPSALTVRADFPADTLEEFVAIARTREPSVSLGHSGTGAVWHLAGALLARTAGFEARFIPFNGAAPAITALVGGHVDGVTVSPGEVRAQVLAGQLKILAIMSEERLALFPEVPTCRESGIDVVFSAWRGLALPQGAPQAAWETLERAFRSGLQEPEFVEFTRNAGLNLAYAGSGDFRRMLEVQTVELAALMEELGLMP